MPSAPLSPLNFKLPLLCSLNLECKLSFFLIDDDAKDECLSNGYVSNGDGEEKERDPMGGGNVRPLRNLFTLYTGEPARYGWRVEVKPHHEALSTFEFDAIVDASGKSNSCLSKSRFHISIAYFAQFLLLIAEII